MQGIKSRSHQSAVDELLKVHVEMSKGFHEKMLGFALSIGMGGLGYLEVDEDMSYKGPIDKFISDDMKASLLNWHGLCRGMLYSL